VATVVAVWSAIRGAVPAGAMGATPAGARAVNGPGGGVAGTDLVASGTG
jgi:hypothetical protein